MKTVKPINKRKFYKTILRVEILSEDLYDFNDLSDIHESITYGNCSGKVHVVAEKELNGKQMADELRNQDSDPEFFQLNEEGEDVE